MEFGGNTLPDKLLHGFPCRSKSEELIQILLKIPCRFILRLLGSSLIFHTIYRSFLFRFSDITDSSTFSLTYFCNLIFQVFPLLYLLRYHCIFQINLLFLLLLLILNFTSHKTLTFAFDRLFISVDMDHRGIVTSVPNYESNGLVLNPGLSSQCTADRSFLVDGR